MRLAAALSGLLVALGLAVPSAWRALASVGRPAAVNVLVVTLDTTRADRLGAYGGTRVATPNLDWLARTGVLFEQATTAAPLTLPAHCTLFTGLFPPGHGVRENAGFLLGLRTPVLAALLQERGYRTGAFVASYIVRATTGLARGFGTFADTLTRGPRGDPPGDGLRLPADVVTDRALAWLGQSRAPFFAWVHFYDAHAPCQPPEAYLLASGGNAYNAAIGFMDVQAGRLIGWLRARALLDRTVVVVIADHGESLGDHGEITHARRLFESVLHVPFILRAPSAGFAGTRVGGVVRSVDVLPTVLALAHVPAPTGLDGVSLVPLIARGAATDDLEAYAETLYPWLRRGQPPGFSIRRGNLKLIDQGEQSLFDVGEDPAETRNLNAARPDVVRSLATRLEVLKKGSRPSGRSLDPDVLARLQALGYVGTPGLGR
jgi:arylsulfatase A-like enzyme